jgi:hypothetical protein
VTKFRLVVSIIFLVVAGVVLRLVTVERSSERLPDQVRLVGEDAPVPITKRMDKEEAGLFGSPADLTLRQQHLANREWYHSLDFLSLPADPTVQDVVMLIDGPLNQAIRSSRSERELVRFINSKTIEAFVEHVAAVLAAAAGVNQEWYVASLPASRVQVWPENEAQLESIFDRLVASSEPSDPRALFDVLYVERQRLAEAGHLPSAVAGREGWVGGLKRVSGPLMPSTDFLDEDLVRPDTLKSLRAQVRWRGMLAQAGLTINRSPVPFEDVVAAGDAVLVGHVAVIVRTNAGDAFPIHITSWYDPANDCWWNLHTTQVSSPRAASLLPIVL